MERRRWALVRCEPATNVTNSNGGYTCRGGAREEWEEKANAVKREATRRQRECATQGAATVAASLTIAPLTARCQWQKMQCSGVSSVVAAFSIRSDPPGPRS